MIEEKNAIITGMEITNEAHGILTIWLYLDYGGGGQGFGGYALYCPNQNYDITGRFIWRVMEMAGVDKWTHLVGKPIRVRAEHGKVSEIGHFLKDIWFNPSKELNEGYETVIDPN